MGTVTRRQFLKAVGQGSLAVAGGRLLAPSSAWAQGPFAGQTIIHWSLLNPEGKSLREVAKKEAMTKFKEKTGITVQVQVVPWQELGTKLIAATQAGNPPDCARTNIFGFKLVVQANGLTPLDPYINKTFTEAEKKDYFVNFKPATMVNGMTYALQIEATSNAIYIRKDWLAKTGMKAPKTWAELVEVGKAMTGAGKWGYMFNGSKTQLNQVEKIFQPQIHGRGGHILDATEKGAFNDEAAVQTYQFLSDCVYKHKITPPQVIGTTYDEVTDAFKGGRVGMIQEGSHRYRDIAQAVGEDNIELTKIPSDDPKRPSPTPITGWGMGIPRGSKHPDAAWEYIKFYTSPEAMEINARIAGAMPSRKSAANRPYFQTKEAAYMRWWMEYAGERGEVIINVATEGQLNEVLADALQQVLNNPSTNIKRVLDEAVKRYNQIIQA